jgi:hypothetical protein
MSKSADHFTAITARLIATGTIKVGLTTPFTCRKYPFNLTDNLDPVGVQRDGYALHTDRFVSSLLSLE